MMLLDTNVISETWRPNPDSNVVNWLNSQRSATLFLCTPVVAEIRAGIERLADGRRKQFLSQMSSELLARGYPGRLLDFDLPAALQFGRIIAQRERAGHRLELMDAMIGAIALANGMTLVTRNSSDFEGIGLDLIDPFVSPS